MSPITTHVLDTSRGRPVQGVAVTIEFASGDGWQKVGSGTTDEDGRVRDLMVDGVELRAGTYRIRFETAAYSSFYPSVEVTFVVENTSERYHIPLLLSPFGYSTYRGS